MNFDQFLTEARAVVQRADEAVQTVKAVESGQRGEIQVGYAPSLTVLRELGLVRPSRAAPAAVLAFGNPSSPGGGDTSSPSQV